MVNNIIEWLNVPISGAFNHSIDPSTSWHGRVMTVAWSLFIPVGIFLARFYKVTPNQDWPTTLDNKFWWHSHRTLNYSGLTLTFVGVFLVFGNKNYVGNIRYLHSYLGWFVIFICVIQIISVFFRGTKGGPTNPRLDKSGKTIDFFGDHYNMTRRRILFEKIHKGFGHLVWLVALTTTFLGLLIADASRWMWILIGLWWFIIFFFSFCLQMKSRNLDTYQAIWGVDKNLPGMAFKPIGWGVNRFHQQEHLNNHF